MRVGYLEMDYWIGAVFFFFFFLSSAAIKFKKKQINKEIDGVLYATYCHTIVSANSGNIKKITRYK